MIGHTLAHYKVVEKLGSGGMGDVYVAEDQKLGRKVALKALPAELADDDERRRRFEREARAVAALNHPNIVTVHSVEEAENQHFITMELVRGKNLAELLPKHGFALSRFFEIAIPLVDAVVAAHLEGITHRDLKPENVMVSDDGRVKVLDFGLAKARLAGAGDSDLATASATREGRIVGTVYYMSPEQAEGRAVDARSDIFSLGVVFYELLTGVRPFGGETPTSVLSSILKEAPRPVSELRPEIPRALARLVHRCLAKDPMRRYQSAIDLEHDLEETKQDVDSGEALAPPRPERRSTRTLWAGVLAGLIAVAAVIGLLVGGDDREGLLVPRLRNPLQVTSALGVENYPSWSPDGVRLAYEASKTGYWGSDYDIWVVQAGAGEPVNLTEAHPGHDRRPSWSPDGTEIAFFSDRDGAWALYSVASIGGRPRKILSLPEVHPNYLSTPQWSSDGSEILCSIRNAGDGSGNELVVLSLSSLETSRITMPRHEGDVIHDLSWSPDESRFAYVEGNVGNTEITRLWVMPATGGDAVALTDGRTNVWSPTWSSDGRRLFYVSNRGGSMDLWQRAVAQDGTPRGDPLPLTQGLGLRSAVFSPDGHRLAYSKGRPVRNVWRVPLLGDRPATWDDAEELTAENAFIEYVDVSPDGSLLAVSSDRSGNQDLWLLPAEGGEMTRLTTNSTPDWNPRWSPDGAEIAFYSYRNGNRDIWVMPSGGGPARPLTSHPAQDYFPKWSPDGQEIAFGSLRSGKRAVWVVDADGRGEPQRLASGAGQAWSPDGDGLVFLRDGRVYRMAREGGEPVLVSSGPAFNPRYSRDGRSIYYSVVSGPRENHDLWSVSLETGEVSRLTRLGDRRGFLGYDFAADGRFLYFTWSEDIADIWVMDVAGEESR